MPLFKKHLKPFNDEMAAAEKAIQPKFAALGMEKDDDSVEVRKARFESAKAIAGEFAGKVKDIRDRLEKAKVPAKIEGRKESLLRKYDFQLKQIEKFQKKTFEEADAEAQRRKGKKRAK